MPESVREAEDERDPIVLMVPMRIVHIGTLLFSSGALSLQQYSIVRERHGTRAERKKWEIRMSILEAIGHTWIVRLRKLVPESSADLNPSVRFIAVEPAESSVLPAGSDAPFTV